MSDTAHARSIPWDCSDWQAAAAVDDAANARVSSILESLATNRGKTLYCAVDQSDTFTKAETWQAGKDRNERDDTVYQGQNGRFRGFLAAQEGYLTDGESGVTGISRERIFEFPEEPKKKRRWRIKIDRLEHGPDSTLRPIHTPWGPTDSTGQNNPTGAQAAGRNEFNNHFLTNRNAPVNGDLNAYWQSTAERIGNYFCQQAGYQRAVNARPTLGSDGTANAAASWDDNQAYTSQGGSRRHNRARRQSTYSATCETRTRVRR